MEKATVKKKAAKKLKRWYLKSNGWQNLLVK